MSGVWCQFKHDWKHSLDKGKGFSKHAASSQHAASISSWREKEQREASGKTLYSVSTKITNDHRRWLETICTVMRHLATTGQPFRGDTEILDFEKGISGSLFLDTLNNLVFELQPELLNIAKRLPKNAKYLPSDIQNKFIEVLANMVREKHATEVKKAKSYSIMVDGTTDKNMEEVQGVVARFFSSDSGRIEEKARTTLDNLGITFDGLVSQAYDGASVMSGCRGGLQFFICEFCGRLVIYIYTYIHSLFLPQATFGSDCCYGGGIDEIKEHFGWLSALYTFYKLAAVKEIHGGNSLKRLIDTRCNQQKLYVKTILK